MIRRVRATSLVLSPRPATRAPRSCAYCLSHGMHRSCTKPDRSAPTVVGVCNQLQEQRRRLRVAAAAAAACRRRARRRRARRRRRAAAAAAAPPPPSAPPPLSSSSAAAPPLAAHAEHHPGLRAGLFPARRARRGGDGGGGGDGSRAPLGARLARAGMHGALAGRRRTIMQSPPNRVRPVGVDGRGRARERWESACAENADRTR